MRFDNRPWQDGTRTEVVTGSDHEDTNHDADRSSLISSTRGESRMFKVPAHVDEPTGLAHTQQVPRVVHVPLIDQDVSSLKRTAIHVVDLALA